MGLRCNIDGRGRVARLIWGLLLLILAVGILFLYALPTGSVLSWAAVIFCFVAGAFAVFEAGAGWCAIRAIGFKTPM
jgi:hypothetical protein